jgi:trehalose utilization protein
MHETIAAGLRRQLGSDAVVSTATFQEPKHGCTPDRLSDTDVLLWWGHVAHEDV